MKSYSRGVSAGEALANAWINEQKRLPLIEYNASLFFQEILEQKDAVYFEFPMKNGALGYTDVDEYGISIMVNKNIESRARKNFTIAHEIGHLLFHVSKSKTFQSYVETKETLTIFDDDFKNDLYEIEANAFAAHLLLPNKVLKYQILSSMNAFQIKKISGISVSALRWRITQYLIEFKYFTPKEAFQIAEDFTLEHKNYRVRNTTLYNLLKEYNNIKPLYFVKNSHQSSSFDENIQFWQIE